MSARADMEAATHAALTKHRQAIAEGTWQRTADNTLVDAILKAADQYALGAAAAKQRAVNTRALDASLERIRAQETHGDPPGVTAERRQVLDAYGTRKRTG